MSQETEIKLSLPPQDAAAICQLPLLKQARYNGQQMLLNDYYDTPDLALHRHRIALRIRQHNNTFIQTLKTAGQVNQGLHQRREWEWPLPDQQLNPALLPAEHWPSTIDSNQLRPVFSTHFQRSRWLLETVDYQIEVALDQGAVAVYDQQQHPHNCAICELELELLDGDVAHLHHLAEQLRQALPSLQPSDISKAQLGYQLYRQTNG